jgi:hypothetical protein
MGLDHAPSEHDEDEFSPPGTRLRAQDACERGCRAIRSSRSCGAIVRVAMGHEAQSWCGLNVWHAGPVRPVRRRDVEDARLPEETRQLTYESNPKHKPVPISRASRIDLPPAGQRSATLDPECSSGSQALCDGWRHGLLCAVA